MDFGIEAIGQVADADGFYPSMADGPMEKHRPGRRCRWIEILVK